MDDLAERLLEVFRQVFDDDDLEITDDTVAGDVEGWDSLNHINLVVAIESAFSVKFKNREIASWKNVGDMRRGILAKLES